MDICNTCRTTYPIDKLRKDSGKAKGYRNQCLDCLSASRGRKRRGAPKPKQLRVKKVRQSAIEKKRYLDEVRNVPCLDCGGRFPPCAIDFDHVQEKSFGIMGSYRDKSLDQLIAEIAKCEIVCANCHRIRTHERRLPCYN